MEGNQCYKFTTIQRFLQATGGKPIETILDVGANTGAITLLMSGFFPEARIFGFEPVQEYFELACSQTAMLPQVKMFPAAVSYQHVFTDDLGTLNRASPAGLRLLKALPEGGPGWRGGSVVVPEDHAQVAEPPAESYQLQSAEVRAVTLEDILEAEHLTEIDLLKIDCEGCEHSVIGCAAPETLRKIRFIAGEYHSLDRFYPVAKAKLFPTHKVNLVGSREMGSFFAERMEGEQDGILIFDKSGMLIDRPFLGPVPIDWHVFDERYVAPAERIWHGMQ